ncbi:MAG TPA: adenylosuccinate synthetase, partial [Rhodothermales bacterium]|nr:adenylosuccinate synthetase [Rhodothermales bacterium]
TGWLDLVALKYTAMINGLTELAITKLDVLSGLETVQAAVAYGYDGKVSSRFPSELQTLARVTPVFTDYSGWKENIEHITDYNDLPEAARNYLQFVESFVGVPIRLVSTGPAREQTIIRY